MSWLYPVEQVNLVTSRRMFLSRPDHLVYYENTITNNCISLALIEAFYFSSVNTDINLYVYTLFFIVSIQMIFVNNLHKLFYNVTFV